MKIKSIAIAVLVSAIIFFLAACAKSDFKEADIFGEYTIAEKLYSVNTMVVVNPTDYTDGTVAVEKNRVSIEGAPVPMSTATPYSINTPYYDVVKITDNMLNNGLYSQGAALQGGIMSMSAREKIKDDCYAIFPEKPYTEDMYPKSDRVVIYYIDGGVYLYYGFVIYRLEKIS